ncbi:HD domain-containing protein [Acetoanaerobium noterae]|uniref:HD domain-containing protein n=1 Tax=Acetoanaerobium noterae TaxID=745369 RepID=A0A1T5CQS0_9FIRM|nr:HD domain-containing phosphohydrolase [Acetoanaerobium noterae]SKB61835.1 HD domain-containing protein [Acetoanaerobium noterae]
MDLMNLNEHGTKENLQRHEANNLRLSYIIRAIFVLNTMGVTILVGKSEFEKITALTICVLGIILYFVAIWYIRKKSQLNRLSIIGVTYDILTVTSMPIIWYISVGGESVSPVYMLKVPLVIVFQFILLILNSITLKPKLILIFAFGSIIGQLGILNYVLNQKNVKLSGNFVTHMLGDSFDLTFFVVAQGSFLVIAFVMYLATLRLRKMLEHSVLLEANNIAVMYDKNQALDQLDKAYKETVDRISKLAEYRDTETGVHIERTREYVKLLGELMHLDSAVIEKMYYAAPMHDVGKVGIPDEILHKKGPLTEVEWDIMKLHGEIGASAFAFAESEVLKCAQEIALSHHEKWDGSGYPNGLHGQAIPLSGRIMAVADIYDALRSPRPYKRGFTHEETVSIMTEGDGRTRPEEFDPKLLSLFKEHHQKFNDIFEQYKDK